MVCVFAVHHIKRKNSRAASELKQWISKINKDCSEADKPFRVSGPQNNFMYSHNTSVVGGVSCCSLPMLFICMTCLLALHSEDYICTQKTTSRTSGCRVGGGIKDTQLPSELLLSFHPTFLPFDPPPVSTLPPRGCAVSMTTVWVGGLQRCQAGALLVGEHQRCWAAHPASPPNPILIELKRFWMWHGGRAWAIPGRN